MCRFAVRGGPPPPADAAPLKLEAPLDLDALFGAGGDELDAHDMALLNLFNGGAPAAAGGDAPAGSSSSAAPAPQAAPVVLGQPLPVPAAAAPPAAALVPLPLPAPAVAAATPVQQLQLQAVMQHQAAIMQNPAAYPAAAQMYQQALLQQQQAAAAQHMLAAAGAPMPPPLPAAAGLPCKRGKSMVEVEEQTERIKKRRRESAQRSRQRKNVYMKSLEMENRALKMENERLRLELNKCSSGTATALMPMALAPKASSGSVSRQQSDHTASAQQGSEHLSVSDDEEDPMCDAAMLLAGGAPEMDDPLGLMPTADLLSFAF